MLDKTTQGDELERGSREGNFLRRADLGLSTSLELPSSEEELKLANIWQQVLGIDVIGVTDDFFELGGDSFAATELAAEIEATFDVRFAPGDIISSSTIAKQVQAVSASLQHSRRVPPHIIVGRAEGSKTPLFFVHGAFGFSFFNRAFLDVVGQDRPIYLFQAPGIDGRTKPLKTVEEIASAYVASMREIQPTGPYCIAGMCGGAFIALEMCNKLSEAGEAVANLILLDPKHTPPALAQRYPGSQGNKVYRMLYQALRRMSWVWRGIPDEFERNLQARAARLKKRQRSIEARRATDPKQYLQDVPPPEERSYSADTMLEASIQLYDALKRHVPRPFAGTATLVLSSLKLQTVTNDRSFWRDQLGHLEYRVVDGDHKDLFDAKIVETARLVTSILEPSSCP